MGGLITIQPERLDKYELFTHVVQQVRRTPVSKLEALDVLAESDNLANRIVGQWSPGANDCQR